MHPENLKLRLYRALSGLTQEKFSQKAGIDLSSYTQYELGDHEPGPDKVEHTAQAADLSVAFGDEVLRLAEWDRRQRRRPGRSPEDLVTGLVEALRFHIGQAWQHLLRLPLPARPPREEDRLAAREQLPLLRSYTAAQRAAVLRLDDEHQPWALCIEAGEASAQAASRDLEEAVEYAQLGREFAEQVQGPEGWLNAIRSRAVAYEANVRRNSGELKEARTTFENAKRLAKAGSDPYALLDPGRLLELEASLYRDERQFEQGLELLDKAVIVGHSPVRALIKKGFTLEVMGDYERAAEAHREAEPKLDRQADPRLWYKQRANLAVILTHLGNYGEASELLEQARPVALELGDEIDLLRLTWLEGRIHAGLGRFAAARWFLEQAQREFEKRKMWYDVALAALELAALLLDEGRTAEVKAMTPELAKVFEAQGVHREALAALELFKEAAEQEAASAALAREVLRFLFRARHDESLRFES